MSKSPIFDTDWFWIVLIVLIVMGFNTLRQWDKNNTIEICLRQNKQVQYTDNNISGCK